MGVDRRDRVYLFHRGLHPLCVFDRDGNFVTSWGDGVFRRAHGVHMGPDDTIYLTDEGDHTVRKCTLDGKVLLTIGIPDAPAAFMSGEPFRRCTHTALSPAGEIYVSDGYGNARIHKYAPDGKRLMSWGEPGAGPGQFNLPHNIACDADGWVYVADRENHRIQVFDGSGRFETQWHDLHRPSGMFMPAGKCPDLLRRRDRAVLRVQSRRAESRTADHDPVERGQAPCADRDANRPPASVPGNSSPRMASPSIRAATSMWGKCRTPHGRICFRRHRSRTRCAACRSSSASQYRSDNLAMSGEPDVVSGFAAAADVPIPYLQRTRDYYHALGYGAPYVWAHYADVPFLPLQKPLAQCRVALITTAAPYQPDKGDQGPGAPYNAAAKFYAVYSGDTARDHDLRIAHVAIDRKHTTAEDLRTYFPLAALRRAAAAGRIGSVAARFHGVPTNRSHRVTLEIDCPELVARCEADAVDAAILVPNCPVCHQSMSLAARALEANGVATVVMGCAKDIVEHVGVPRLLFSDFPLGNAAGRPGDPASQAFTLDLALQLLESAPRRADDDAIAPSVE